MSEEFTGRVLNGEPEISIVTAPIRHLRISRLVTDIRSFVPIDPTVLTEAIHVEVDVYRFETYAVFDRLYGFWVPDAAPIYGMAGHRQMEESALLLLIDSDPTKNELHRVHRSFGS